MKTMGLLSPLPPVSSTKTDVPLSSTGIKDIIAYEKQASWFLSNLAYSHCLYYCKKKLALFSANSKSGDIQEAGSEAQL
jgi:hypothetical protein